VLAGRPANAEPLAETGRLFGRRAHLLDAVEVLDADRASGAWNPIAATGATRTEVRRLCDDAVHGIRLALSDVAFIDGRLTRSLLCVELERAVDRVFDSWLRQHEQRHQTRATRLLPFLGRRTTTRALPGSDAGTDSTCGVGSLTGTAPDGGSMASR